MVFISRYRGHSIATGIFCATDLNLKALGLGPDFGNERSIGCRERQESGAACTPQTIGNLCLSPFCGFLGFLVIGVDIARISRQMGVCRAILLAFVTSHKSARLSPSVSGWRCGQ